MNSLIHFKKIRTVVKLMLALLIAAFVNVVAAEAILIPLHYPAAAFNPALHTHIEVVCKVVP